MKQGDVVGIRVKKGIRCINHHKLVDLGIRTIIPLRETRSPGIFPASLYPIEKYPGAE
jgi:hypothetical protein